MQVVTLPVPGLPISTACIMQVVQLPCFKMHLSRLDSGLLFPAGFVRLLKQDVNVADGKQHIALCEQTHSRDDVALPEDHKWLQRILHIPQHS